MNEPRVYIIVLNYNNWKDTIECCNSLLQLNYSNYKVIICDNNSNDESKSKFAEWKNEYASDLFFFIYNKENLGYAGGNNVGIRYALKDNDCEYVWLLNNDTIVTPEALQKLIDRFNSDNRMGLCGSLLYYYYQPDKIQAISGKYNPFFATSVYNTNIKDFSGIHYPVGASMMASRAFIEEIGLLSEDYFLYYEELDWVMRVKGRYTVGYAPKSIVYHKEGATMGGKANPLEKSELSDFYALRNRIIFTKKFFPDYIYIVYLGLIISMLKRIKRRQWRRAGIIWDIIMQPSSVLKSYQMYRESKI